MKCVRINEIWYERGGDPHRAAPRGPVGAMGPGGPIRPMKGVGNNATWYYPAALRRMSPMFAEPSGFPLASTPCIGFGGQGVT